MVQRVLKVKEKVKKLRKGNRENEITIIMFQCLNAEEIVHNDMSMIDLNDLAWLIDQNLKETDRRLEKVDNNGHINQVMTTQS